MRDRLEVGHDCKVDRLVMNTTPPTFKRTMLLVDMVYINTYICKAKKTEFHDIITKLQICWLGLLQNVTITMLQLQINLN